MLENVNFIKIKCPYRNSELKHQVNEMDYITFPLLIVTAFLIGMVLNTIYENEKENNRKRVWIGRGILILIFISMGMNFYYWALTV